MKKKLTKEIKRSTKTAIVAAFGFLIALVWRDLIINSINRLMEPSPIKGEFVNAIVITVLSVIGIFLTNKIIKTR